MIFNKVYIASHQWIIGHRIPSFLAISAQPITSMELNSFDPKMLSQNPFTLENMKWSNKDIHRFSNWESDPLCDLFLTCRIMLFADYFNISRIIIDLYLVVNYNVSKYIITMSTETATIADYRVIIAICVTFIERFVHLLASSPMNPCPYFQLACLTRYSWPKLTKTGLSETSLGPVNFP